MIRVPRLFAILLWLATPIAAEPLVIFAAASLKGPLDEVAGQEAVVSYGGSGTLARQIMQGAPADIVILAHPQWMDVLAEGDYIAPESRVTLLSNRLVLVAAVPGELPLTAGAIDAARAGGRVAMGLTTSVPAGIYGRAALEHLGLWQAIAPHVAEVDNVRAALALVVRGQAPLGIVYATDAAVAPQLHIAATFPPDSYPTIRYEAAIVSDTADARAFLARLQTPDAQGVFAAAGFVPLDEMAQ